MKKLLTVLAALLLLSLVMGIALGPLGNFLLPLAVKATLPVVGPNPAIDITKMLPTDPPLPVVGPNPAIDITKLIPTDPTVTPKPDKPTAKPNTTPKPSSGSGQTMTSEGPLFLSFRQDLTDEFYMFTPVDLSVDDEYHFPLVGSSSQVVGEAKVVVTSGLAIVNYYLVNGVALNEKDEFFTFFPDIQSVQTVKPSDLQDVKLKFGVPYSVATWLGSDPSVLLYINCPISYKTSQKGLGAFYFDDPLYLQKVIEFMKLMD